MNERINVTRLSSGYFHLRGKGILNWSQPPNWPCDEKTLRDHALPEASEQFIRACMALVREKSK